MNKISQTYPYSQPTPTLNPCSFWEVCADDIQSSINFHQVGESSDFCFQQTPGTQITAVRSIKNSPYLGTLGVWDRSVLRVPTHALPARGQTGCCRLCKRQSWDSVLFGFKTECPCYNSSCNMDILVSSILFILLVFRQTNWCEP